MIRQSENINAEDLKSKNMIEFLDGKVRSQRNRSNRPIRRKKKNEKKIIVESSEDSEDQPQEGIVSWIINWVASIFTFGRRRLSTEDAAESKTFKTTKDLLPCARRLLDRPERVRRTNSAPGPLSRIHKDLRGLVQGESN